MYGTIITVQQILTSANLEGHYKLALQKVKNPIRKIYFVSIDNFSTLHKKHNQVKT